MSIENEIIRLQNAKASIKTAIEGKGVTVGDDVKLDGYAALIDNISVGSGDGEVYENPDFYNVRTFNGTDYSSLFNGYYGTNLDLSNWDTSKVTDMRMMFNSCSKLTSLDLSNFNTSSVIIMDSMFYGCSSLTSLDLSNFNTSSVTDMSSMFNGCSSLTSLDLSSFNTSKITDTSGMFQYSSKLTYVDITGWDTSKVKNMNSMFYSYSDMALRHIYGELDLSGLTNGFYPGSYADPLGGCKNLQTLYLKNIYKNCTIKNESKWSINLGNTVVKDECLIYIINELPDLINDKKLTSTNNIILTLPKTNTLTEEQVKIATDKGWQVANTTYHLSSYTVTYNANKNITYEEKQIVKEGMPFSLTLEATGDYVINSVTVTMGNITVEPTYVTDNSGFITAANINITSVNNNITIIATTTATTTAEYTTFTMGPTETGMLVVLNNHNNSVQELYVENIPQDLPQVSVGQLLNGEISEEIEITTLMAILPVKEGDTIKIKGGFSLMANMLFENMVFISNITIQSSLEDCSYMFAGCIGLTETPAIPINAVNCDSMFTVTGITEAPVIPKNVKNCKDMFSGAAITKAPAIPEGVIDCTNMFNGCVSLTEANIIIPSSTTTCENMFNGCVSLTEAPIILEGVTNTNCMFMGCTSLTTAAVIPTTVTNCGQMYSGCTNLQDITQQNVNLMPAFTGYCNGCYEECTKIVEPINYTQIPDIWREP